MHGSDRAPTNPPQDSPNKVTESPHLTFVEEILLLLLDDETGAMKRVAPNVMELLIAGAILMDLALRGGSTATCRSWSSSMRRRRARRSSTVAG